MSTFINFETMYLVKTPYLLKKLYPSLIWNQSRKDKVLYITFDDGPIPNVTPFVLEELRKYNAKATFFCIGDNVNKHPEIFKQVVNEGHSIGNHTFNHLNDGLRLRKNTLKILKSVIRK